MLRRAALACVLLLGGCEAVGDLTSDAFDKGTASQSRFEQDSAHCQVDAALPRDYDIRGVAGTHIERHEIFNRAYTACMQANGYVLRDFSPDAPVPYDVRP